MKVNVIEPNGLQEIEVHPKSNSAGKSARLAFAVFITSWIWVVLAVTCGQKYIPYLPEHPSSQKSGIIGGMVAWDGEWFARIATQGYDYSPTRMSSIVFFPACPLLARGLMRLTGLPADVSLILVSNIFLLAAFLTFARYMRDCHPISGRKEVMVYTLLAMAWFPSTFYFRMGYTESLLLFLMVLAMHGMRRNWPLVVIALIIGAATATRSVGVALLVPFALHLWKWSGLNGSSAGNASRAVDGQSDGRQRSPDSPRSDWRNRAHRFVMQGLLLIPLACWGLVLFMGYQLWAFGDPLVFAKGQVAWYERSVPESRLDRALDLITLEPVLAVYTPESPCYWAKRAPRNDALLNMNFANPILFVGTFVLVVVGGLKGWLDRPELALSVALLAIPYVLQSNRMGMTSHARYASVVFPAYIVMGHLLSRLPKLVSGYLLFCSGLLMGAYAALFSLWYFFF
ncbi:MAG TPA: mannosyltransferase family protein [Tepidisphaeraceae bacterium]|nr:mannosyltransferase family protein [Tepidisphaeraceae bacterium]